MNVMPCLALKYIDCKRRLRSAASGNVDTEIVGLLPMSKQRPAANISMSVGRLTLRLVGRQNF